MTTIDVRVARTVALDVDAFSKLATELLEDLDTMQALLPRLVVPRLREQEPGDEGEWGWADVVRNWVNDKLGKLEDT